MRLRPIVPVLAILVIALVTSVAGAANDTFVGILAMANEDDVARQLGLSDDTRTGLAKLIAQRENEATELAMQKNLPADEQAAKLKAFREESEKKGLELLGDDQRRQLEKIRVGRAGLISLAEPEIAKKLQLSEKQQQEISEIVKDRDRQMARATAQQKKSLVGFYEKKLGEIVTEDQRARWEQLASSPAGNVDSKPLESTAEMTEQTPSAGPTAPESRPSMNGTGRGSRVAPSNARANAKPTGTKDTSIARTGDGKLVFQFRNQPWKDALDWFAQQADLSLVMETVPTGTLNYQDDRAYTVSEAIDVLNKILLRRDFALIRSDRMLQVVGPLKDGIPPGLVPMVTIDDLPNHGKFELVSTMFPVNRLTVEEAAKAIEPFLSLQGLKGSIIQLPQSRQLMVTETAGNMRLIKEMLDRTDNPTRAGEDLRTFTLHRMLTKDFKELASKLIAIPEGTQMLELGGNRLLVRGSTDTINQIANVINMLDGPAPADGNIDLTLMA